METTTGSVVFDEAFIEDFGHDNPFLVFDDPAPDNPRGSRFDDIIKHESGSSGVKGGVFQNKSEVLPVNGGE